MNKQWEALEWSLLGWKGFSAMQIIEMLPQMSVPAALPNPKKALASIQRLCLETKVMSAVQTQNLDTEWQQHTEISVCIAIPRVLIISSLYAPKPNLVYTSLFLPCSSHYLICRINFLWCFSNLPNILEVQSNILKRIYNCHTKAVSGKNIIPSITSIKQKLLKHRL